MIDRRRALEKNNVDFEKTSIDADDAQLNEDLIYKVGPSDVESGAGTYDIQIPSPDRIDKITETYEEYVKDT